MLPARILSALIFFALFLLGLFHPSFNWVLPVIITASALWGTHEFLHFGTAKPTRPFLALAMTAVLALMADAYWGNLAHSLLVLGLLTVSLIGLGIILKDKHITELAGISLLGTVYVALPLALIVRILVSPVRVGKEDPQHYIIFLILVTWASDIGAYSFGRLFGRHKLAPTLSPGKTIEGFIGGIVLTLAVAIGIKLGWDNIDAIFHWWEVIFLALVFSTLGPAGDLAESWLKRSSGIKDSGHTFTGHGGMLDIIDSLLFTAVFYYGFLWLFHTKIVS